MIRQPANQLAERPSRRQGLAAKGAVSRERMDRTAGAASRELLQREGGGGRRAGRCSTRAQA